MNNQKSQMFLRVCWTRDGGTISERMTRHDEVVMHVGDLLETPLTSEEMQRIAGAAKARYAFEMRQRAVRAQRASEQNKRPRQNAWMKVHVIDQTEHGNGGVCGHSILETVPLVVALSKAPNVKPSMFGFSALINDRDSIESPLFRWDEDAEEWKPGNRVTTDLLNAIQKARQLSKAARRAIHYFAFKTNGGGALMTSDLPPRVRAELEMHGFELQETHSRGEEHNFSPLHPEELIARARAMGIDKT